MENFIFCAVGVINEIPKIIFLILPIITKTIYVLLSIIFCSALKPLMHNVLKWSDILLKSCSICFKIFKACLTVSRHYALKGKILIRFQHVAITIKLNKEMQL